MFRSSAVTRTERIAISIAVLAMVSGCEGTNNWLKRITDSDKDAVILGAPGANEYLNELYELTEGDPATQAEIYVNAKTAAEVTPGTSTQLRYALVLATPGHAENDDLHAQSLLIELLSEPDLLTQAETALASIHLHEVEERLVLNAEAERLRAENARAASTEDEALAQRIANVEAENRRLKRSLADAQSKLEALSSIERSLREQSGNAEPQ